MLYSLKAPKHLLFHLILVKSNCEEARQGCNLSSTYRWVSEAQRSWATQGHMALIANPIYSNWPRLLDPRCGFHNFWVVSGDNTNRKNDPSVTHWKQRKFKKSQSGLLHHRRKWMIAFILCYGLNPVPSNFICRSPNLPLCTESQHVTPYWDRVFKETIKLKCRHIGRS